MGRKRKLAQARRQALLRVRFQRRRRRPRRRHHTGARRASQTKTRVWKCVVQAPAASVAEPGAEISQEANRNVARTRLFSMAIIARLRKTRVARFQQVQQILQWIPKLTP